MDAADPASASRAGAKLAGVLAALATLPAEGPRPPVVDGARCLDVGASTGGFTDVLLRAGAREVVAVDVGHDQLVPALRADPRVRVHEGLNVRELAPQHVGPAPDVVVADLSFISLALVLPPVAAVVRPGTDLLVLVKPQFEVGRERLGSGGVVRDGALHAEVVVRVGEDATRAGLRPVAVVPSPLPGPSGNREYFWWLRADGTSATSDPGRSALEAAAHRAVTWDPTRAPSGPPVVLVAGAAPSAGTAS